MIARLLYKNQNELYTYLLKGYIQYDFIFTFETRKYIFYYTSKAIFVLKILKFQHFRSLNFMASYA